MYIKFRVNNEIINIECEETDELKTNLMGNDTYTVMYMEELARIGQISIPDPITKITRFTADNEEELVYSVIENLDVNQDEFESYNPNFLETDSFDAAEDLDTNITPSSSQTTDLGTWSDNETKFLLDKFYEYLPNIGPIKEFKTKKIMWEQIATDIEQKFAKLKSAVQIENRYKTVIRRKKNAIVNNSKSGRSRQDVPFEEELNKIARIDDSIEPQVIRSAKKVKHFKQSAERHSDSDEIPEQSYEANPPKGSARLSRRRVTSSSIIAETLKQIAERSEIARQARHEEKLKLIRELFGKN